MPRAGLTREAVVARAAQLIDAEGLPALSLAELAKRLGVRTPSLYNHVDGLDALKRELRLQGLREMATALRMAAVGKTGVHALSAVARAYRSYARERPGIYSLTLAANTKSDPEIDEQGAAIVEVALAVLAAYGLEGEAGIHATRVVRSALHGFVSLELAAGFALEASTEQSFGALILALDSGMRALTPGAAREDDAPSGDETGPSGA